ECRVDVVSLFISPHAGISANRVRDCVRRGSVNEHLAVPLRERLDPGILGPVENRDGGTVPSFRLLCLLGAHVGDEGQCGG
ncbi:hypothetical protein P9501_24490, partial [Escherichia coli]|uniref:hypothetical protein n=1 Tax=Escherichia coli TaxID=562 RepID=UPI00398A76D2